MFVVRAGKTAQDGTRLDYRREPRDLPLYIRGNPNRPGPIVPRRFIHVLAKSTGNRDQAKPFVNGSGRLELANAITDDAASLTARVIVNRIWTEHFGQGLVATPSNFGQQGSAPTHPELLDDLAARFIASGWSIKRLHREILLSATWQQASEFDENRTQIDPENRWLSRMNRRRLPFESWRDSILAATRRLDLQMSGPSDDLERKGNNRRTVYATIHRRDMSTTLTIHDFPDPTQHSPRRSETTTPLQGLYALNGPLLNEQSALLASSLLKEFESDTERSHQAYRRLYAREPSGLQRQIALDFLGNESDPGYAKRWIQYAHVLLLANELLYVD